MLVLNQINELKRTQKIIVTYDTCQSWTKLSFATSLDIET